MKLLKLLSIILCLIATSAFSQKNIKLSSPDRNIQYAFRLKDKAPVYSVSFKDKLIIENSGLSLSFLETGEFKNNLRVLKPVFREAVENYELIVGKVKSVRHPFKEVIIPLEETKKP
ncbi:MAG: glycoside hydrolase family 97 N-terminal domain-containing protein, partial [Gloeobacteraceae cyanobacterium ES-bin-316]|nr:glycoside hydrolase family 97 N-terminal domain-containing protein [Ferruginibacter sp.]